MPSRTLRTLLPAILLTLPLQLHAQASILLTPTFEQGPVGQPFFFAATLDDPLGICTTGTFQWQSNADTFQVIHQGFPTEQVGATWFQSGEKVISVSYDGCTVPTSAEALVEVNGCRFDTPTLELLEGEAVGIGIQRISGSAGSLTCELSFLDGTATVDEDFVDPTNMIGWFDGDSLTQTVEINALVDEQSEDEETFSLFLKVFDGESDFVVLDEALVTVLDQGTGTPVTLSLSPETVEVDEGGTATLGVLRDGPTDGAFFFSFEVVSGSAVAGEDFESSSPPATLIAFPAGVSEIGLSFPTFQDELIEGNEQFSVELLVATDGVVPTGNLSSLVTIVDDDSATVSFVDRTAQVAETEGVFELALRRTGTDVAFEVDLVLGDASATPGVDFEDISQTVSFAQGVEQLIVPIPIVPDHEIEDSEFVAYTLQNASNGVQIASEDGTITGFELELLDSGSCAFSAPSFVGEENLGALEVVVRRFGGAAGERRCRFATSSESEADAPATPEVDYTPVDTLATFADSERGPLTFAVPLLDDDEVEPIEGFDLVLSSVPPPTPPPDDPRGATTDGQGVELDRARARIVSEDRDDRLNGVRFTAINWIVREGRAAAEILVRRVDPDDRPAAVSICPIPSSGSVDGSDIDFVDDTVEWPASEDGVRAFRLLAVDDELVERTELLAIELCRPIGAQPLTPQRARVIVVDNDLDVDPEETAVDDPTTPGLFEQARNPSVAKGPDGRRFVVWQQRTDIDTTRVVGAVIDPEGSLVRRPFLLSTDSSGNQINPRATRLGERGFYAVWQQIPTPEASVATVEGLVTIHRADGSSTVVGRGFDDDESGEGDDEEETELSEPDEDASEPDVDSDGGGNVTTTWRGTGGITGVQLGDDGLPDGPPIDLVDLVGSTEAELAMTASGDFVVVWLDPSTNGGTVLVRTFDQAARPTMEPLALSTAAGAATPSVAISDDGEFFVVWSQPGAEGLDVFGQRFVAGSAVDAAERINGQGIGDQVSPSVDLNTLGEAAVVWQSRDADGVGSRSLLLSLFDDQGEAVVADLVVADDTDGSTPADPDVTLQNSDLVTVVYERLDNASLSLGVFRRDLRPSLIGSACDAEQELCVRDDRFALSVGFEDFAANNGDAAAVPLTPDTGYFWFFNQDNVEVVVKVLDGCALNGSYWVFAAGLTNTEVQLRVDDTWSGVTRSYFSELGAPFTTITDTTAFATCDLEDPVPEAANSAIERISEELRHFETVVRTLREESPVLSEERRGSSCSADAATLCLNQQRFAASVDWQSAQDSGVGQAAPLTDDTGTFWFFSPDNIEVIVKVLDACASFGNYWIFAAGLTDVGTTLTVTDSQTMASRSYTSELGQAFPPLIDFEAFVCTP